MAAKNGPNKKLNALVFYAVDKASPYALAMHPETNSVAKLADYTLSSLGITEHGASLMWLWINAHCLPDAKPVSADAAIKCEKVSDVQAAVLKNIVVPQ